MFRNQSVSQHQFSMIPRADIPRSAFNSQRTYKTTLDAGFLIPILCEEVLPGDTWNVKMTAFARLATPIFPLMDNVFLDSFFFFVPNRLVWDNWRKMMGEQANPTDSISYVVPQSTSPVAGYTVGSLHDYFGLPTVGQVDGASTVTHNVLPLRAYNLIWNEWFRDENLQDSITCPKDNGPDAYTIYSKRRRGKRPDYFTSALPWPQKGGASVSIPLGSFAPVYARNVDSYPGGAQASLKWFTSASGGAATANRAIGTNASAAGTTQSTTVTTAGSDLAPANLWADLATASAATINQLRQSFQIQKLLERDARGGTRYTELLQSHFGVRSPDARLQRPEYLGGGSTPITLTPIAQTSASGVTGGSTPLGNLAAFGTMVARDGFSSSFVEHGYVIGLVSARADLTYQQGLRKHWSRSTRYDFYWPAFAMLGEQVVYNREIYCTGLSNDSGVFGYQERWAEYRYSPSEITGKFRSTAAGTLDAWHAAQRFTSLPTLGDTFISENPPLSRVLAVGAGADGAQLYLDAFFNMRMVRPMPLYSVPGLIDHF